MSNIEANCSLVKKDGRVIGITLTPTSQVESEMFCGRMPKRFVKGKGEIRFEAGVMSFVDTEDERVASFSIGREDAISLQSAFNGERKLVISEYGLFTGFLIIIEGMEEESETAEEPLTRTTRT